MSTYSRCTCNFVIRVYASGGMLLPEQRMKVLVIYYQTKLYLNLVMGFLTFYVHQAQYYFSFFNSFFSRHLAYFILFFCFFLGKS